MRWEELIAEARSAGVLAFCADGIAVLKRSNAEKTDGGASSREPGQPVSGEDRQQGRESGHGQSQSTAPSSGS